MNGIPHLGHGYAVSLLDFYARFERARGKEVFFPFAFHGTGMPIVACANKVRMELEDIQAHINVIGSQLNILKMMDIREEEFVNFIDPKYWVTYFSERSKVDLMRLNISTNFDNSFITTDMNPYFDKFIKWQFKILADKGLVTFGEMPIIFSEKEMQACSDHDRSEGEGKSFVQTKLAKVDGFIFKNRGIHQMPDGNYMKVEMDNVLHIVSEGIYNNLRFQKHNIKFVENVIINESIKEQYAAATNTVTTAVNKNDMMFEFYEPECLIKSRSGATCVVAIVDQWFINYDAFPKDSTISFVENEFKINDPGLKKQMVNIINWLKKWPVSRSKETGLGTQLFDTEFVIDSLSDSTIYMALYPIYNMLTTIDIEQVNDELFNAIYFGNANEVHSLDLIIHQMRESFLKWYPVDVRLSGKDLIPNHLTMSMLTHNSIFGESYMPQKYYICGHVTLKTNGIVEKMSKSKGNFITVNDAIKEHGSDAVRLTFAEIEADVNDAVYGVDIVNSSKTILHQEEMFCTSMIDRISEVDLDSYSDSYDDAVFRAEIYFHSNSAFINMDAMKFRNAKVTLKKLTDAKKSYMTKVNIGLTECNYQVIKVYIEHYLKIMQVFCPTHVETIYQLCTSLNMSKEWQLIDNSQINSLLIWKNIGIMNYISLVSKAIAGDIKKKKLVAETKLSVTVTIGDGSFKNKDTPKFCKIGLDRDFRCSADNWFDLANEDVMITQYLKAMINDFYKYNVVEVNIVRKVDIKPWAGTVRVVKCT
jgi:leucyl-tRNA synthetase